MRTRFMAEKPNDILFTLKIEGTAAEFDALRAELSLTAFSGGGKVEHQRQIADEITKLLVAARKVFYPVDGESPALVGEFMGHKLYADPAMPDFVVGSLKRSIDDKV